MTRNLFEELALKITDKFAKLSIQFIIGKKNIIINWLGVWITNKKTIIINIEVEHIYLSTVSKEEEEGSLSKLTNKKRAPLYKILGIKVVVDIILMYKKC